MAPGGSLLSHYYNLSNEGRDSYVFGRGGGVSVIFKAQASNNKIIMYKNILEGNQADLEVVSSLVTITMLIITVLK